MRRLYCQYRAGCPDTFSAAYFGAALYRASSCVNHAELLTAVASPHLTRYSSPLLLLLVAASSMKDSAVETSLLLSKYSYFLLMCLTALEEACQDPFR